MTERFVVRLSPTILNEYDSRAVFGGEDGWPLVPSFPVVSVDRKTAEFMLDDAEYNGSVGKHKGQGPDEMPLAIGNAYRALAKQIRAAISKATA